MRNEKGQFLRGFHASSQTEFKKGSKVNCGRKRPDAQQRFKQVMNNWWRENPTIYNKEGNPAWRGGTSHKLCYDIWEEYWREPVPNGYIIHHADRNSKNNEITNLALVTRSLHGLIHRQIIYEVITPKEK